jgi:isoamylase
MMNMFWESLDFEVPLSPERVWHVAIDTFASMPHDITDEGHYPPLPRPVCTVQGRSIIVLVGAHA